MRYVYLDESIFSEPNNYICYGALICDDEVPVSIIDTAFENLKNDPDIQIEPSKTYDDRTLLHQYFHASEDSKNAHSHLCTSINRNLSGHFDCQFFDIEKLPDERNNKNNLFDHLAALCSISALDTRSEITFIFENRGSLNIDHLKDWYSKLVDEMIKSINDNLTIPTIFQNVSFKVADKSNPGIQCVDFLTWIMNRKYNGEATWLNRIQSRFQTFTKTESGEWGGASLDFGHQLESDRIHYSHEDFNDDYFKGKDVIKMTYLQAEYVVHYFTKNELTSTIVHFKDEIDTVYTDRFNLKANNYIERLAYLYLKLFDTAPLIDENTCENDRRLIAMTKKIMAIVVRHDLIHGVRSSISMNHIRRKTIEEYPAYLNFD
jgi:hypothetical protein